MTDIVYILYLLLVGLIVLYCNYSLTKNEKFRLKDGRLIELSATGAMRVCLDDEETRKIMAESLESFHNTFTIDKEGNLVRRDNGAKIPLD